MLLSRHNFTRLCQARDLLCSDLENPPSIREIAQRVGVSPFHMIRQFESLFGSTPRQLLIRQRIGRAKQLLAAGSHSVTEACMEVGFSSLGSFSSLFTREVGMAPSAYRRCARTMISVPGLLPEQLFPGCLSLMGLLPASAFRNLQEAPAHVLP
jgi:AraC-like DNA-binding protein